MKNTAIALLALLTVNYTLAQKTKVDLSNSADNFTAYIKFRGSLDSNENVVYYASGRIYSFIPEQRTIHLFNFEMYNIARMVPTDSGYKMLTREMLVYKDPKTDTIINQWNNPFTKEVNEVYHIWNDPVNQNMNRRNWMLPYTNVGPGKWCFHVDVPLLYPSPLKKAEYPKNSRSDLYQAAELFQFYVDEKDLNNKKLKSVPCQNAWTRVSDFLPWMGMGDRPGYMLFQGRGYKVPNGFNGLPQLLKDYVMANDPTYAEAPKTYVTPNMTSWKYFKMKMDAKKATTPKP
jgi:hypothetical protein